MLPLKEDCNNQRDVISSLIPLEPNNSFFIVFVCLSALICALDSHDL